MNRTIAGIFAALVLCVNAPVWAEVTVGEPAPPFSEQDAGSQTRSLENFKGKVVVLEWFNPECPFIKKHYSSGNMQKLQQQYTGKGVTWLSVNSSAEGKQGHIDAEQAKQWAKTQGAAQTAILLDGDGTMGKAYGAKTTPHMFVIDPDGKVVYHGAIDDDDSADPAATATAKNYVAQALDETLAGQPVTVQPSQPYGCSVKY